MKKLALFIFLFLLILLPTIVLGGSNGHSDLKGNVQQKLGAFMAQKAKTSQFNGVVLVAKNGKAIFEKGYGYADVANGIHNQTSTEFRIASLTKSFTAVSILQLEEAGKLKTTDPISKYFPTFQNGDKITIHNLLTHSSGVANHFNLTDTTKPISLSSFIELMGKQKLTFSPGTKYKYSDTGYMILASIIEKVSGESYMEYYKEHIFDIAGMQHTYFRKAEARRMAIGYENMKISEMEDDESQYAGAGDIISTVDDMLKYNNAFLNGKLLSSEKVKEMETGYIDTVPLGIFKYGYGWLVADNLISFGKPMIEHSGNLPGFKSDIINFPEDRITIIVLSNNHGPWVPGVLTRELASISLDKRFWFYQKYY
ncbi:MAG: serine hydrolase domain-containing protein [Bacillota bacterium]|nr:serine hydrolase domain-containing protein [Bacillota bacterium]